MILVVGATGLFGRDIVQQLAAGGTPVRALTRKPQAAELGAGVEVVGGDLADPATLGPAVDGVSAMALVLPYGLDPSALLKAATEAGVRRVVFLSSGAIGATNQPNVIADYHAGVERQIAESGLEWTVVRLFFPAINTLTWAMQLSQGDVVRGPYAGATSAPVHEADVAEVAVAALTGDGHAGKVYDVSGPDSLTQLDQVRILGETLGRPLAFDELEVEPVKEAMGQFMDPAFIAALFDLMADTVGKPAAVTTAVQEVTGHPARTFAQWAADHVADFR